jgi:hypothetical protein
MPLIAGDLRVFAHYVRGFLSPCHNWAFSSRIEHSHLVVLGAHEPKAIFRY